MAKPVVRVLGTGPAPQRAEDVASASSAPAGARRVHRVRFPRVSPPTAAPPVATLPRPCRGLIHFRSLHPTGFAACGGSNRGYTPAPLPGRDGFIGSGFHGFRRLRRLQPWLPSVAPCGAKTDPPKLSCTPSPPPPPTSFACERQSVDDPVRFASPCRRSQPRLRSRRRLVVMTLDFKPAIASRSREGTPVNVAKDHSSPGLTCEVNVPRPAAAGVWERRRARDHHHR